MVEMDEMERAIRDRSQTYGFRFAVCALSLWTLYGLFTHFFQSASYNPLPACSCAARSCTRSVGKAISSTRW